MATRTLQARIEPRDDDRPRIVGWRYGRQFIGTWAGPPPAGAVDLGMAPRGPGAPSGAMKRLDLRTGAVTMFGPVGRLP